MNLDEQIQSLIDGAPDLESRASVTAIAPILQQVAATLPQPEYYICQSSQGEWELTTLRHRQQPDLEIKVIYAFTSIKDLTRFNRGKSSSGIAVKIPIVQLLFDLLAFPDIDRTIFLNDSDNLNRGREISRQELEDSIVLELQQRSVPLQQTSSLPPDVC
jgi:hypothetical protein